MTLIRKHAEGHLDTALETVCNDLDTKEATEKEYQSDLADVQKYALQFFGNGKVMDEIRDLIDSLTTDTGTNNLDDYNDLYDLISDKEHQIALGADIY